MSYVSPTDSLSDDSGSATDHIVPLKKRPVRIEQEDEARNESPLSKRGRWEDEMGSNMHKEYDNHNADDLSSQNQKPKMYSTFAEQMMAKMGHVEGTGLGKTGQGITAPIETSLQKGRRGLGKKIKHFEPSDIEWKEEQVHVKETIIWMPPCVSSLPALETMMGWIEVGKKKRIIDDETEFCEGTTLHEVLESKSIFDELEGEEMRRARTRSNPYETIRGGMFLNRAAMKMANMDSVVDFIFTNPRDKQGRNVLHHNDLLYFADVCAGPGGFSEYVLWRKGLDAKGFGFTLKGGNDFKLEDFHAAPSELFEPHYGDGDIYKPDNLREFQRFVLENTGQKGVHFVMADGGFSVEGQENIQEILSKRLYLCQFLCALSILRPGGHFVCKLFDLLTPFSVGLVYLMYHAFEKIAIFKPVTSRPANSERYIVCEFMKAEGAQKVHDYMFEVNLQLQTLSGVLCTQDVNHVVPLNTLLNSRDFYDYIHESNENLGKEQVLHLKKIQTFAKNADLYETRQSAIREDCLKEWRVPDEIRKVRTKTDAPTTFSELINDEDCDCFDPEKPTTLTEDKMKSSIKSVYDFRCMVSGCQDDRLYLLGLGRTHIFKWDGRPNKAWRKLDEVKLELPTKTLIEVEIVQELRGEGRGQRKLKTVHITDVLFLYGEDCREKHFTERIDKARKFIKAINKPSRLDLAPLRVKDVYRLEDLDQVFQRLAMKSLKGRARHELCYSCDNERHYQPTGLILVKTVKEPWTMAFSRSQRMKYFYNIKTQKSLFEIPADSIAPFA